MLLAAILHATAMTSSAEVDGNGNVADKSVFAPDVMPYMRGCIASVAQAVGDAGEEPAQLLEAGEYRRTDTTALMRLDYDEPDVSRAGRWGVMIGGRHAVRRGRVGT